MRAMSAALAAELSTSSAVQISFFIAMPTKWCRRRAGSFAGSPAKRSRGDRIAAALGQGSPGSLPAGLRGARISLTCIALGATDLEARAADLYLAAACVAGDPAAIAELDASLPAVVRPALARLGIPAGDDDEIEQRVRVALLVRDADGGCGLAGDSGRGELRAYLRAAEVRIARHGASRVGGRRGGVRLGGAARLPSRRRRRSRARV